MGAKTLTAGLIAAALMTTTLTASADGSTSGPPFDEANTRARQCSIAGLLETCVSEAEAGTDGSFDLLASITSPLNGALPGPGGWIIADAIFFDSGYAQHTYQSLQVDATVQIAAARAELDADLPLNWAEIKASLLVEAPQCSCWARAFAPIAELDERGSVSIADEEIIMSFDVDDEGDGITGPIEVTLEIITDAYLEAGSPGHVEVAIEGAVTSLTVTPV